MTSGVLLMAHGTPASPEEILPFYTRIRRGRPPEPEQLAELESRYRAIGGVSPLAERTRAQVDAVRAELQTRSPGRYLVVFGAKHTDPLDRGCRRHAGGGGAGEGRGPRPDSARVLHGLAGVPRPRRRRRSPVHPSSPSAPGTPSRRSSRSSAARVTAALGTLQGRRRVIFTAHSLPARIRQSGDTYPEQLAESARLVAEAAGLGEWLVAWQSAGRTTDPWLGPDVRDEVRRLAGDGGTDAVVVCPIGFVADHLEVLYDLDVEVAAIAAACGIGYAAHRIAQRRPRVRRRAGRRDRRGRRGSLTWLPSGWSSSAGASAG